MKVIRCVQIVVVVFTLAALCVTSAVALQKYDKTRVMQETCSVITSEDGSTKYLNLICEDFSHTVMYDKGDPAPTVQTGRDGNGDPYFDIVAPSGLRARTP